MPAIHQQRAKAELPRIPVHAPLAMMETSCGEDLLFLDNTVDSG
jgi:hypothetical protein